ncbi:hypothetical protein [Saccharothrix sp. Mg75]|uniref:hypothetical protein n=1 Tax=Saccharothrix sp. Mg75 TaxID=3445357 RepID=UPI003EED2D22
MVTTEERTTASPRFDWAVAGGSTLLFGGVVLDGWAHHNLASALETFFTPWHAVLYSGFAVVAAVLVIPAVRSRRSGLRRSLPDGYLPSLLGVALFLVGGAADLAWHLAFDIEVDLEAALSPTHLLSLTGGVLVLSGPLRSAWRTHPGGSAPLPAVVSLVLTSSLIGFFAEFGSVFNTLWPAGRRCPARSNCRPRGTVDRCVERDAPERGDRRDATPPAPPLEPSLRHGDRAVHGRDRDRVPGPRNPAVDPGRACRGPARRPAHRPRDRRPGGWSC